MYRPQKLFVKSLILTGLMTTMVACSKEEPASDSAPVIAFKSVNKFTLGASATKAKRDSVMVTISFSDGNGDLGEDLRDTTRLKNVFGNQSWGNYEIRTFQFVNNKFDEFTTPSSAKLFVDLGGSTILPQAGTLDYKQLVEYTGTYKLIPVKFQIRMRDRNLNESNIVETDTLSIPIRQ